MFEFQKHIKIFAKKKKISIFYFIAFFYLNHLSLGASPQNYELYSVFTSKESIQDIEDFMKNVLFLGDCDSLKKLMSLYDASHKNETTNQEVYTHLLSHLNKFSGRFLVFQKLYALNRQKKY